jgi:hypothetical protein
MKDQFAFSPTLGCFQDGSRTVVVADSPAGFANIIDEGSILTLDYMKRKENISHSLGLQEVSALYLLMSL